VILQRAATTSWLRASSKTAVDDPEQLLVALPDNPLVTCWVDKLTKLARAEADHAVDATVAVKHSTGLARWGLQHPCW